MRSVAPAAATSSGACAVPARALPYLAAGLRTGITLSLVGAVVVAEWTGADSGLG